MDLHLIQKLIPRRRMSATIERRLEYVCEYCGFKGIARAIGRGSADRTVLRTQYTVEAEAHGAAAAQVDGLLLLRSCPRCGKRNSKHLARFQRAIWRDLGSVAVGVIALVLLSMRAPTSTLSGSIFLGIVGIVLITVTAHFEGALRWSQ